MTDTRKEFEEAMKVLPEFRLGDFYVFSGMSLQWKSWQACQSLNDKRIENYKSAYDTWQDKTEWVQETSTAKELGLHRADVLKNRIEQLLAVIAKKDEALIKACELIEKFSLQVYNVSDCLKVYDAVELQPSDVELVDASNISDDEWNRYKSTGEGIKFYTIKTKASTK